MRAPLNHQGVKETLHNRRYANTFAGIKCNVRGGGAKPKVCIKRFIIKLKKKRRNRYKKALTVLKQRKKERKKRSTRCILLNINRDATPFRSVGASIPNSAGALVSWNSVERYLAET